MFESASDSRIRSERGKLWNWVTSEILDLISAKSAFFSFMLQLYLPCKV